MSSVPGLPIDIVVNDKISSENLSIKVKSAYGRIFKWVNMQPIDDTVNELELEYVNQTIYWSPLMDSEIDFTAGIPILVEITDKSDNLIIDEKLIFIESLTEHGFYSLAETNTYEKLYLEFLSNRNTINNYKSKIENNLDIPTLQFLKDKGINDYSYILTELENHPEMIPFDGVLGGTMRWYGNESK